MALAWAAFMGMLFSMNLSGIEKKTPGLFGIEDFDKLVHAGLFFVLAFLSVLTFYDRSRNDWLSRYAGSIALLFCLIYGGVVEVIQATLLPHRSGDWRDLLFDMLGALLGVAAFLLVKAKLAKSIS